MAWGIVDDYALSCVYGHIRDGQREDIGNKDRSHAVIMDREFLHPFSADLFRLMDLDTVDQFIQHTGVSFFARVYLRTVEMNISVVMVLLLSLSISERSVLIFSDSSFCSDSYRRDILAKRSSDSLPETLSSESGCQG